MPDGLDGGSLKEPKPDTNGGNEASSQERSRSPRLGASESEKDRKIPSLPLDGDFWASPQEVQQWQDTTMSQESVAFQARLVSPQQNNSPGASLPLAFYFTGLHEQASEILDMDWTSVAPCAFILVVPCRPGTRCWFIDDSSTWGWATGKFCEEMVQVYATWMTALIAHPRIDRQRIGVFGFSAGAYAALEMFGSGLVPISGLGLGGVHGHGQSKLKQIPSDRAIEVKENFKKFRERVAKHKGAGHIEVIHGRTDAQCSLQDARLIAEALTIKQLQLGFSKVKWRLLDEDQQDSPTSEHHDYMKAAFMCREFFQAFLADKVTREMPMTRSQRAERERVERVEEQGKAVKRASGGAKKSARSKRSKKKDNGGSPSTSTLKVTDYSVSINTPGWKDEAYRIFCHAGFVLIQDVLSTDQCEEVHQACESIAEEIVGPSRSGNRGNGRYSFGVASSTGSILHVPAIANNLLNHGCTTLYPLLCDIFWKDGRSDFHCYSGGGDFVLPGVEEYQKLHSDMQVAKRLDIWLPPPMLSVNFIVQELTSTNGPTRMIPGKWDKDNPRDEPDEWKLSRLFPVPAGTALVRDVRILHGGTPNVSAKTRYLPSVEFISGILRATERGDMFPPWRSVPRCIYETLSPQMQEITEELIFKAGEEKVRYKKT